MGRIRWYLRFQASSGGVGTYPPQMGEGVPVSQNPVGSAPKTVSGSDRHSLFLHHDPH